MTTPKLLPRPIKNPYKMPLLLTTFDPNTQEVKSYPFGSEVQWEQRWDKFTEKHSDKFCTLWSPFFDHEARHVTYMKLICDCKQFREDVNAYDWEAMAQTCKDNAEEEDGQLVGRCYIGTVMSIMPSGKYYTPWAHGNVTEDEAMRDEIFMEYLEGAATSVGGSLASGEGDPCDMFLEMVFPLPEEIEDEDVTDTPAE